jgi:hypothetical protein
MTAVKTTARQASWRVARAGLRTVARPTSALRPLPEFLIIGAQRCGTTSLHRYLQQHPAVLSPRLTKGVHWFDTGYDRPLSWYRSHFPTSMGRHLVQRRVGHRPITGEGSPYYLFHPHVAGRLHRHMPAARLLVILRDPVARAWSQYHHEVRRGFETLSFEDALEAEAERLSGEDERLRDPAYRSYSHQHHSYLARGRYFEQLERVWQTFPEDQVLVLLNEELSTAPDRTIARVHEFLHLPARTMTTSRRWNRQDNPDLPPHLRSHLLAYYRGPNRELAARLAIDLPWPEK